MDIEAIKRRVERIQTSNLSLVYPYQLIEDAESLLERVTALEAERDAAQHRANILAGCLTSVLQVVDGDPDDDCEYCGEIVSEGHDGRCIVPVARQALTAAPVREVELRAEEQAHNDALDEIERLTEAVARLRAKVAEWRLGYEAANNRANVSEARFTDVWQALLKIVGELERPCKDCGGAGHEECPSECVSASHAAQMHSLVCTTCRGTGRTAITRAAVAQQEGNYD